MVTTFKKKVGKIKRIMIFCDFSINFGKFCEKYCINFRKNSWDMLELFFVEAIEI